MRVEAVPDQAATALPSVLAAWPLLVLCAADACGDLTNAFLIALRAAPETVAIAGLVSGLGISPDRPLSVHSVVVVVFGRDSSRGDLLFTPAVSLPASLCDPPLDRTAVNAYDQFRCRFQGARRPPFKPRKRGQAAQTRGCKRSTRLAPLAPSRRDARAVASWCVAASSPGSRSPTDFC